MNSTYRDLSIHRWMLRDGVRNEAYRRAIAHAVKPGDVVLDMGAGTGVLSIFAAHAGARKVYAVERTDIAEVASRVIESNGLSDRIEVMHTDLEDAELPERVDVVISEWMGGLGVDENMLAPLVMARDRWLKPGGLIVPGRVTAFLAPAWLGEFDDAMSYWRSRPHDVELGVIAELTANESFMTQTFLTPDDLVAPPQAMWSHDAYTCTLATADQSFRCALEFAATRPGKLSGLVAWFAADMGGDRVLTNAVGAPNTHWGRILLPLDHAIDVVAGTAIAVEVACDPSETGTCEVHWAVAIDGAPAEHHDTRRGRRSRRDQF